MGCCLSKNPPPSSSSSPVDRSCSVELPDPNKSASDKVLRLDTKEVLEKPKVEESKPKKEETEIKDCSKPRKEVFVIKHRRSHEKSSKIATDLEDSSVSEVKSTGSNHNPVDVDAILIQCGRMSRNNSARRYSGSKRSFDFDQNGDAEEADAEDGGDEEEAERRIHRRRQRGGSSPRERRRRTPSRERDDSKSYRSGSRERGSGNGGRRVSRSPGKRSETNPNPNSNGSSAMNNRPGKFVSVPATDKALNNNGEESVKRITVKRNIASPRSQSPASQPSPSKLSRKSDRSPYRRNPLGEIDTNYMAFPVPQGVTLGSGNTNGNKRMMNKDNELNKESGNFPAQKLNPEMNTKTATQVPIRRTSSPSRAIKEQQDAVEECKTVESSKTQLAKPQISSMNRSLRKSRDFDFSPEALLSNNIDIKNINSNNATAGTTLLQPSYTALLLEDIQNFHQKSVNVNTITSSMSKACSIVEAITDLNSTTNQQHQRTELSFKSAAVKKADIMEPSFEKYVTVKRGGSSLEDMEEQESSGSNSFTGSSCVMQQHGCSSWEPNSAESSIRLNKQERDRSPLGMNFQKREFDPLKKTECC